MIVSHPKFPPRSALICLLILTLPAIAVAQSQEPLATATSTVGARPIAFGSAYHALGGDFYSLAYNPAGLGLARQIRFDGSLTHRSTTIHTRYFGGPAQARVSSSGFDGVGVVYPVPTVQGSLVFAVGAYRLYDLDSRVEVEGYNTSDDPDLGETAVWARDSDRGSLYAYGAGVSLEAARGFFLGFSLEALSGENTYRYRLEATDIHDYWLDYWGHDYDDGITYTYSGGGLRFALGGLWRPIPPLSLGASVRLPHSVRITEDWYQQTVVYYEDNTQTESSQDGIHSYDLRLPHQYGVGGALRLAGATVAVGGTYLDFTQSEYSRPPYDGADPDYFANNYQARWQWGGGIELSGISGWSVRAGYQWAPLLFRPAGMEVLHNREWYSFGVGLPVDPAISLDLTYQHGSWETVRGESRHDRKTGRLIVSFGYRFE